MHNANHPCPCTRGGYLRVWRTSSTSLWRLNPVKNISTRETHTRTSREHIVIIVVCRERQPFFFFAFSENSHGGTRYRFSFYAILIGNIYLYLYLHKLIRVYGKINEDSPSRWRVTFRTTSNDRTARIPILKFNTTYVYILNLHIFRRRRKKKRTIYYYHIFYHIHNMS